MLRSAVSASPDPAPPPVRTGTAAGIVLAAGASTRMGEPKQLLTVAGRPLLELVVAQACASRLDEVLVVLGAHAQAVRRAVELGRARVIVNPEPDRGMSSSLQAGLAGVGPGVDRVMIILGDQPGLAATTLDALLDAQRDSGLPAAALRVGALLQPPVVLHRSRWAAIAGLSGDVGLRGLLREQPELVASIAVPPGDRPIDIDTPDDYRRLVGGDPA